MSIVQITTRDTQLEKQRIGFDATMLELDTVPKVSVGSVVECSGTIYEVTTAMETPTGTPADGTYLFFDPAGPSFVWSAVAGTYDATKGGIYDGSNRRQCRFILKSSTGWREVIQATDLSEPELPGGSLYLGSVFASNILQAGNYVQSKNADAEDIADGATKNLGLVGSVGVYVIAAQLNGGAIYLAVKGGTTVLLGNSGGNWFAADAGVGIRVYMSGSTLWLRNSDGGTRKISAASLQTVVNS